MKKILLLAVLSLITLFFNQAQDLIKTEQDNTYAVVESETYNQFLDNYLRVQFRSFAYEVLHLDENEITAADPILMDYLKAKNELYDRRLVLINQLQTDDGLEKLTQTIEAIVIVNHLDIDGLYQRTTQVMQWAEQLQSPDNVENHALLVRKAFIEVAELIQDIADYPGLDFIELANEDLLRTAKQIDPEILYIEQAPYTYNFFQQAQHMLNEISL